MTSDNKQHTDAQVPLGVRIAAAWSWRLLLITVAVAVAIWLITQVSLLAVPLMVAILLAALLYPLVRFAESKGLPRGLGVVFAFFALVLAVTVLVWLIVTQFSQGFSDLWTRAQDLWKDALAWVSQPPLNLDVKHLNISMEQVFALVEQNQSKIWTGAMGFATSTANFFAGALLTIFALIFFLYDGKRIWFWVLGFFPANAQTPVNAAAKAGWVSVGQYVRVQIFVAFVDAVGIAIGAWILQVPLVIPIGIMVFLGSFIPFLGAIVTGAIATLIALIYNGPVAALIMLAVVLLVQQLESHILQPLVMGSVVKVHPLGVVLAVSMGAMVAGIPGALFAVPVAASANSIVNTLAAGKWRGDPNPLELYRKQQHSRSTAKRRLKTVTRLRRGGTNPGGDTDDS